MNNSEKSDEQSSSHSEDLRQAANTLNPPFVTATPFLGETSCTAQVIDDSLLVLSSPEPSSTSSTYATTTHSSSPLTSPERSVYAEAVYFDEISAIQEQYDQNQSDRMMRLQEEEDALKTRRTRAKALVLICLCLVIGGGLGAVIGIARTSSNDFRPTANQISNATDSSMPVVPPMIVSSQSPSLSTSPSVSPVPSAAPSCQTSFGLESSLLIVGEAFSNYQVSSDASTAVMMHIQRGGQFNEPEAFYFDTFDIIGDGTITRHSIEHDAIDLHHMQLSADGSRLVVGTFGYANVGGALLVYSRRQSTTGGGWLLRYKQLTGGGVHGSVFHVASDAAGLTFAAIVGVIGSDSPSFARVYRASMVDFSLIHMGQRFVDSSITQDALVGLSADGLRFFLYTADHKVIVYDYLLNEDRWEQLGEPIKWEHAAGADQKEVSVDQIKVSDDGTSFLLVTGVIGDTVYIFQQDGDSWRSSPLKVSNGIAEHTGTFYYHYGDLSADGSTVALSTSYYARSNSVIAKNEVFIYQERHNGWRQVDLIELPYGGAYGGDFLGIALDETGEKLVVAGQDTIQKYSISCDAVLVPESPAPSATRSPTLSPTCADSFELSFSIYMPLLGAGNVFLSQRIESLFNHTEQYVVSRDGSTAVTGFFDASNQLSFLNSYDLTGTDNVPAETTTRKALKAISISGDGQRLVAGVGLTHIPEGLIPFNAGGSLILYQDNGTVWELLDEIETGGGINGLVFDVSISDAGTKVAVVAGEASGEFATFVSVYSINEDGVLLQLGNSLLDEWLNQNATVGIVEDRLFVSSSDGFVHAYDLEDGAWQRAGEPIAHFDSKMILAATNSSVIVTASPFSAIQVFEYQGLLWKNLDLTILNGRISGVDLVSVAVSSDGREILVTEFAVTDEADGPTHIAKLFKRTGDVYYLNSEVKLFHEGILETTRLTDIGDMAFVFNTEVAVYTRIVCATP